MTFLQVSLPDIALELNALLCSLVKLQDSFCHTIPILATKTPVFGGFSAIKCGIYVELKQCLRQFGTFLLVFIFVVQLQMSQMAYTSICT